MNIPPAQLWIGSTRYLEQETISYLQKYFCTNQGCKNCITCNQLKEKQFYSIMWLTPEKQFTLSQLEPIFEKISFAHDSEKGFFFIIERADFLTSACANSLLKSVEEPPSGYHFIFLAERQNFILPTIKSRCITKIFHQQDYTSTYEPLLYHLKNKTDATLFLQTLDQTTPNEIDSIELTDLLFNYWSQRYIKGRTQKIEFIIKILQEALRKPPMPGSSKIFWKNLYLQINQNL